MLASEESHTPPTYMDSEDIPPLQESDIPPDLAERLMKDDADVLRSLDDITPDFLTDTGYPSLVSRLLGELGIERGTSEFRKRKVQEIWEKMDRCSELSVRLR